MSLAYNATRPGTTLVELIAAMGIMSVLLGAMGSTIFLATKALPDPDAPLSSMLNDTRTADTIAMDMRYAIGFTERSLNAVTFTVADRTGDSLPETLRYAWSGTPGDPLTRQYNSGTIANVLDNVQQFSLAYKLKTKDDPHAIAPEVEGVEQLFLQQDDAPTGALYGIGNNGGLSEYFEPALPADAISWKITRAQFMGQSSGGATATIAVDIREADTSQNPTSTVIDTVQILEANLIAGQWHQISYTNATGLDPARGYHITFTRVSGSGSPGDFMTSSPKILSSTKFFSSNDGTTWAVDTNTDLWLWVWGTVTAPDPNWTPPTIDYVKAVEITLRAGTTLGAGIEIQIPIFNLPRVAP